MIQITVPFLKLENRINKTKKLKHNKTNKKLEDLRYQLMNNLSMKYLF